MELTEHIAAYLRSNGFTEATSGYMPQEPSRIATVYATGVCPRRSEDGSRFQVVVRSEPERDTAIGDAMQIIDLLDGFEGITSIDSPYYQRIVLESGATALGADENRRLLYSVNFRAFEC